MKESRAPNLLRVIIIICSKVSWPAIDGKHPPPLKNTHLLYIFEVIGNIDSERFFLLRIPDSYHAKTLKNHTPLVRYASYFYNQTIFHK